MNLTISKAEYFLADFDLQFRWYEKEAGWELACRYLEAVDQTLQKLAKQPDLGRPRHFASPELQGLRSFPVIQPFGKDLIFYRHDQTALVAVRIMHGARELPRRLRQPPGAEDDEEE